MTSEVTITPGDRLGVTVTFSLILHGIVLLGVGFSIEAINKESPLPALDVILVHKKSSEAPEKADFLAQADQVGGGNTVEKARPTSPIAGAIPKAETGISPRQAKARTPAEQPRKQDKVLSSTANSPRQVKTRTLKKKPKRQTPTARQLVQQSLSVARLEAEIGQELKQYAKRPRRRFISANTREYIFASYMQAWVQKVQRVGNLNYPDEARQRKLNGNLVMTVAIKKDGSVESIVVVQPSGEKVLDESARQIVQLAAPYAALPPDIAQKVDILHITRTWQFLPSNVLSHQ